MENNNKYLPYIITAELAEQIKQGNQDAINKVYFDNLGIFKRMAGKYVRNKRFYNNYSYEFDDLVQQIYCDLQLYDFTNHTTIFYCIRSSFCTVLNGGLKNLYTTYARRIKDVTSLDKTYINNNGEECNPLLDRLTDNISACDFLEYIESSKNEEKRISEIIDDLPLSNKMKKVLKLNIINGYSYNGAVKAVSYAK